MHVCCFVWMHAYVSHYEFFFSSFLSVKAEAGFAFRAKLYLSNTHKLNPNLSLLSSERTVARVLFKTFSQITEGFIF